MAYHVPHYNATRGSAPSFSTYLREEDFPILPAMISLVRPWDTDKGSESALWRFDISVKGVGEAFIKPVEERNDVIARWNPCYERFIRCVHPVKGKTGTARKSRDRVWRSLLSEIFAISGWIRQFPLDDAFIARDAELFARSTDHLV